MTVAGIFSSVKIMGNFDVTSLIEAKGPDGEISSIYVKGDMAGIMSATRRIGRPVVVKGRFTGKVLEGGVQVAP